MGKANGAGPPDCVDPGELERFRNLRHLHNHWSRPIGPPAYYWYLTFENSPELRFLAEECQSAISFPYYDLTPPPGLHLTLDRIAFEGDITASQLGRIETAATRACADTPPFDIIIGPLGGTASAIGFAVSPARQIWELRDTFRAATLSAYPGAPVTRSEFHAHVAIAYANADGVPAGEVIAAVEELNSMACVGVTVNAGTIVLLERRRRSYMWEAVSRIALAG